MISTARKYRHYSKALTELGVTVYETPHSDPIRSGWSLLRRLTADDIDKTAAIICHSPAPSLFLKAAHRSGILRQPVVDVVHSERFRPALEILGLLANRWADAALPVSVAVARARTTRNYPTQAVIYGAVAPVDSESPLEDIRQRLHIPQTSPVVLTAGRLTAAKGHTDLVRAITMDPSQSVHAVVLGEGPQRGSILAEASRLGVQSRVHMVGLVNNPMRWMAQCDLYCQPSHWEGLPVVLMEAQTQGCVIVATDVGGAREVVTDPQLGRLVRPHDPEALWLAIRAELDATTPGRQSVIRVTSRRWEPARYVAEMEAAIATVRQP